MMNNINYKEFLVEDIFTIHRGKRHIKTKQKPGDFNYVSSKKFNNGIDNYISFSNGTYCDENVIALNNSGSVGYCFYHKEKTIFSDHVTTIKIIDKSLNEYIALYLTTVFERLKPRYSFGREISNKRLEKEKIILPVQDDGKPAWEFMENHVKKLADNIVIKKRTSQNISTFKYSNKDYKEFYFGDIFTKFKRGTIKSITLLEEGDVNIISTSTENNSINKRGNVDTYYENKMTLSLNGKCMEVTYQEEKFNANGDIGIINEEFSVYVVLYLKGLLEQIQYKYSFGRKPTYEKLKNEVIVLPVDETGSPDWKYIEDHMIKLSTKITF